ncbi:hypothetical protein QQF64_014579 [Cirrhinus molitorella]|uniref:Uncharacterized protein n=1 Tax=Cirrhinus molitorella TaxID=172907 RepID=A0ABR3NSP5_9TELE
MAGGKKPRVFCLMNSSNGFRPEAHLNSGDCLDDEFHVEEHVLAQCLYLDMFLCDTTAGRLLGGRQLRWS